MHGVREGEDEGFSRGIRLASLAVLLVAAVALAGCAENDAGEDEDLQAGEGMVAMDGVETAEAAAMEWSGDATLVGAFTFETSGEEPPDWPEDAFSYEPDGTVGDGLAPAWAYSFADGGDSVTIFVSSDGETYQDSGEENTSENPLESWSVDSTGAVEAAKEDEDFAGVLEAEDAEVGYLIGEDQDGPMWWLTARSEEMDEEVNLFVDAETGEVEQFPQA